MDADNPQLIGLMFTDIQGSTKLLARLGEDGYRNVCEVHSNLIQEVVVVYGGEIVDLKGDSFFVVFAGDPCAAVLAAVDCQLALFRHEWPVENAVRVRMGVHAAKLRRDKGLQKVPYVGLDVHQTARLCEAGHGGQILISASLESLTRGALPKSIRLIPLGQHHLRDMPEPEQVFQVCTGDTPSQFPPLRALDTRLYNVPVPRTSLIGREREIQSVTRLLFESQSRLITLTGPAGCGKTRLAAAVTLSAGRTFSSGVCFVSLAPVLDHSLVISAIIRKLGLQEFGAISPEEIVVDYLRDRHILIILDNFEHLMPAASRVSDLLHECPYLKVIVTSRAVLRVQGELEYKVSPLELPPFSGIPPCPDDIRKYSAINLFVERAELAHSGFQLTPAHIPAICILCAKLDGLPLAIELAAAPTRRAGSTRSGRRTRARRASWAARPPRRGRASSASRRSGSLTRSRRRPCSTPRPRRPSSRRRRAPWSARSPGGTSRETSWSCAGGPSGRSRRASFASSRTGTPPGSRAA